MRELIAFLQSRLFFLPIWKEFAFQSIVYTKPLFKPKNLWMRMDAFELPV